MRTRATINVEIEARRREVEELKLKILHLEEEWRTNRSIENFALGDIFKSNFAGTVMIMEDYMGNYLFSGLHGDSSRLYISEKMTKEGVLSFLNSNGYVFVRNGNSKV